jgi:outer membrane protein OmpA-like peptidoglycan-associated protein
LQDTERARADAERRAREERRDEKRDARDDRRDEKRDGRVEDQAKAEAEQKAREAQRQAQDAERAKSEADRARGEAERRVREERRDDRRDDKRDARDDRRDERRDAREDRQDNRQDDRGRTDAERARAEAERARSEAERVRAEAERRARDLREDRRDARQDLKDDRRDDRRDVRIEERQERWRERRNEIRDRQAQIYQGAPLRSLDDVRRDRRQFEEAGRTIIEEPGGRRIIRGEGRSIIRHDESARLRLFGADTRTERRDNVNITIVRRPDGSEIVSEVAPNGYLLRRYRRYGGREIVIIDNRRYYRPEVPFFVGLGLGLALPEIRIPREKYVVEYRSASDEDLYDALTAPPIERLERSYSLEEVRYSNELRSRMRRIDLDEITFETGSWEVNESELPKLERLARMINRVLDRRPSEVFMIEGYTDAVGPAEDNLTLSDRRAEAVAVILTDEFGVPPENLVTQGFGEQFLKIATDGPERLNRRVSVRRITPLISERRFSGESGDGRGN